MSVLTGWNIYDLLELVNDQIREGGHIGVVPEMRFYRDIENDDTFLSIWFAKEHWQRTISVEDVPVLRNRMSEIGREIVDWLDEKLSYVDKTPKNKHD